jgi:hypothetical protein
LFTQTFRQLGYDVVYQPSCLQQPYNQHCWPIAYPAVTFNNNTLVIMHCQDFVSINYNYSPELAAIEEHFGKNANQVVVIHWNYNLRHVYTGPLNLIYFPTHSYELLLKLRGTKDAWAPRFTCPRTHKWQSLNGYARRHRQLVASKLKHYTQTGILSLGTEIPLPNSSYSTYANCDNETNWYQLLPVYSDCEVNVVTETQYYEKPGIISEKTLMAFLALQLPIVIGYQGIVNDCEQLGFDMFRDLVNTTYDAMPDTDRWHIAIDDNANLLNYGFDRDLVLSRLHKNQLWAISWPERLVEHFITAAAEVKLLTT